MRSLKSGSRRIQTVPKQWPNAGPFDFFKATASSDRIDRILLSGGASKVDGFAHALQERFGAPVEAFDPFKKIGFEPDKLGVHGADSLVPIVAVAVGLALRKGGDR